MHSLSYFQLELQILPNAVHIYRQELTAKQIIALCASHVTLYCATYFFLIIGNLFVLSYFFPLSHQPERKVKEEDQKEKYKRQQCTWQGWRITERLSVIECRPQGRRNGDLEKGGRVSDKSPSKPLPSPCRGLYLWSTKEEGMTTLLTHNMQAQCSRNLLQKHICCHPILAIQTS